MSCGEKTGVRRHSYFGKEKMKKEMECKGEAQLMKELR